MYLLVNKLFYYKCVYLCVLVKNSQASFPTWLAQEVWRQNDFQPLFSLFF